MKLYWCNKRCSADEVNKETNKAENNAKKKKHRCGKWNSKWSCTDVATQYNSKSRRKRHNVNKANSEAVVTFKIKSTQVMNQGKVDIIRCNTISVICSSFDLCKKTNKKNTTPGTVSNDRATQLWSGQLAELTQLWPGQITEPLSSGQVK